MTRPAEIREVSAEISVDPAQLQVINQASNAELEIMFTRIRFKEAAENLALVQPGVEISSILGVLPTYDRELEDDYILTCQSGEMAKGFTVYFENRYPLPREAEVAIYGIVRFSREVIIAGSSTSPNSLSFAARISPYEERQTISTAVVEGLGFSSQAVVARKVIDDYKKWLARKR